MAELKTSPVGSSVEEFLASVENRQRQADAREMCAVMAEISGEEPVMWGPSIVGFGSQHLVYESGRELDWMRIGLSPRKANLTLYLTCSLEELADELNRLGPHTAGKGCLYIKKLADIDQAALRDLITVVLGNAGD